MEVSSDVKQVQIDYLCPECKMGYMLPISNEFNSSWNTGTGGMGTFNPNQLNSYEYMANNQPARYMHECNNPECNHQQFLGKTYPYIDYVKVNKLDMKTIHDLVTGHSNTWVAPAGIINKKEKDI